MGQMESIIKYTGINPKVNWTILAIDYVLFFLNEVKCGWGGDGKVISGVL